MIARSVKRLAPARVLVALLAAVLVAPALAQEAGTDPAIHPGDDFFAFANGEWLRQATIPPGQSRWTARHEIAERTTKQVEDLFEAATRAPRGTLARQVGDFVTACADERAIERRGLAALAPYFREIDAVRGRPALVRLIGREVRADVDPTTWGRYDSSHVLGLAVVPGNQGERDHVAYLTQGGLGLAPIERYGGTDVEAAGHRKRYEAYLAALFREAGFDRPKARAARALALEIEIARTHVSPAGSAAEENGANAWERAQFAERAPGIPWEALFRSAGLADAARIVVWQPEALRGLARLLAEQPIAAWQDYLRARALDHYADALPARFGALRQAFRGAGEAGPPPARLRGDCVARLTRDTTASAVSRLYVEKHFPVEAKAQVREIATAIRAVFRERVSKAPWLSEATRRAALAKLDALYFGAGYPERWPDYASLSVDPSDALGNARRLERWTHRQAVDRLGTPADRTLWWVAPHVPGGAVLFHQNAYNFSAALLQPPRFDPADPVAAQYGSIGAILAHEISHFVDTLGADYDAAGRKRRWWTEEDFAGYRAATAPLVAQFSGERPLEGAPIDGTRTLVENLADLGGLAAAFDAYRASLAGDALAPEALRQSDRAFFIAFARAWRAKYDEKGLGAVLAKGPHAPERYRAATVRNFDAWHDAFDVKPGHRLYRAPAERIRIW